MKDNKLRAIVIQKFYDLRRQGYIEIHKEQFNESIEGEDLMHICDQLGEKGLITWKPVNMHGVTIQGAGKITAPGIDVVESEGEGAPLDIAFPIRQNITFNSPSNVQIGNNNTQQIQQVISDIISSIESSDSSTEDRESAKSLLRGFVEHPLVTSLLGGSVGVILGRL